MPESNTEPFERLQLLAGTNHVVQMQKRHAIVLGLGGVGSYVVEALVRGGIGHITVVDPDCSASGNINRQLYALYPDIGQPKVELAARRCHAINPQLDITTLQLNYSDATAAYILGPPADCVFDCIDTISAKIDLIERCTNAKIPLISSMGAGNKTDPSQIKVDDIFATTICRLARIIRKELRRRGVDAEVPVVYSTEEFRPLHQAPSQRRTGSDWCKAPLGTCSYIPPLFGYAMAGHMLQQWIKHDMPAAK
ncbi:MAG: tRNA threonylcarbamoyladenosine dehydratase [Desulfuromonadaceae bacterium]|nr:tRNA threonylcarbamoyladenosine dehydratase [Desulfuromonas sp.]MDY0184878.1 tRNA threonylcarbamoyladenosine dehydratase [Desulfuromonadaceae bacterium]